MSDLFDDFMSGGSKSAKFDNVGDVHEGTICGEITQKQQTDMNTGEPRVFPSGDPMYVYLFPIATQERDDEDDDGVRTLWVNYEMKKAIQKAVVTSGAKRPERGGYLKVTHSGAEPTKFKTKKKLYTAEYTPPGSNSFMTEEEPAQAETPVEAPAPKAAKKAAPAVNNEAVAQAMAALSDEQKKALGLV